MPVAVPRYLGNRFEDAPPGHRFRLYFSGWDDGFSLPREGKDGMVAGATSIPQHAADLLERLVTRQDAVLGMGAVTLLVDAVSEAPFVTGMGIEHPLENGFAFLDPYGLPYLPGSSVKGVLRRAAEELALFESDSRGWSVGAVWWLFGFDASSAYLKPTQEKDLTALAVEERRRWREAYLERVGIEPALLMAFFEACASTETRKQHGRDIPGFLRGLPGSSACQDLHLAGALDFWDVLPVPPAKSLRVDIMNPHFGKHYQGEQPPTDDQNPNPIFFLSLPPGCSFSFHVRLTPTAHLPDPLRSSWKDLVTAVLEHAFAWTGFGAKTAIGYGRMRRDLKKEENRQKERVLEEARRLQESEERKRKAEEAERASRLAAMNPVERLCHELEDCSEERVHVIYNSELDKVADVEKKQLAEALKSAYQYHMKWDGKQSNKQMAKVSRLKSILGES